MEDKNSSRDRFPGGATRPNQTITENNTNAHIANGGKIWINESIVDFGRPALTVERDHIERSDDARIDGVIQHYKKEILNCAVSVGKICGRNDSDTPLGTCWIISRDHVVTCAHVVTGFSASLLGQEHRFFADFGKDERGDDLRIRINGIIDVDLSVDLAILGLDQSSWRTPPPPLMLAKESDMASTQDGIFVIGYPTHDGSRNQYSQVVVRGDAGVKRIMPGTIMANMNDRNFTHDCSTTGGVSGAPIFSFQTGAIVGIHAKGLYQQHNTGIHVGCLLALLEKNRIPLYGDHAED